jgi:hypothetical protein
MMDDDDGGDRVVTQRLSPLWNGLSLLREARQRELKRSEFV